MYKERFIAVIKHNGKILRENGDHVCLPFESEYSIMLKNLESRKAVVNISVDGENVLDGKSIIVDPNSDIELKGFMECMRVTNRFKFIQKTDEISDFRGDKLDDGIVRVEFTFEKKKVTKIVEEVKVTHTHPTIWWQTVCPLCGTCPCTCHKWYSFNNDGGMYYRGLDCGSSSNYNVSCNLDNMSFTTGDLGTPLNDEGITVKGSKTTQDFVYGYTEELEESSSVIVLRLKGTKTTGNRVEKPITVQSKLVCPTCGRKSKSSARFCRNCGTCLE